MQQVRNCFTPSLPLLPSFHHTAPPLQSPHHNWLKEADEGTEATPLLHQGTAHSLLLRLLHQQAHVGDILHGTVQLRLQVPSP